VQTLSNKTLASPVLTGDPTAPTPATSDSDTSVATTAFVKAVLLAANPVGSIEFNVTGTNPSTYIGGTWAAWGSGRVPVGVDGAQTEFDTVEETGGAKTHTLTTTEIPSHQHVTGTDTNSRIIADSTATAVADLAAGTAAYVRHNGTRHLHLSDFVTGLQGGGGAHNNLQPYITCYMWKRTA
jgi:hypothetical protein